MRESQGCEFIPSQVTQLNLSSGRSEKSGLTDPVAASDTPYLVGSVSSMLRQINSVPSSNTSYPVDLVMASNLSSSTGPTLADIIDNAWAEGYSQGFKEGAQSVEEDVKKTAPNDTGKEYTQMLSLGHVDAVNVADADHYKELGHEPRDDLASMDES